MTALILSVALFSCKDARVGTADRPFTMYFVPSMDAEKIASGADTLTKYLEKQISQKLHGKDSGFVIKSAVPASYVAVVEAFGAKRADFAAVNAFSYVLAKDIKKYGVEAVVAVVRGDGEKMYKAQILAHADSGINSIENLNGKKFAFVDASSMAGFILPKKLFKDKNINLGQTVFGQKHDNVVTMIYQKQVDAGATYYSPPKGNEIRDARARVKAQYPDIEDKVQIVGFTEETPNEPWILRTGIFEDTNENEKLRNALVDALLAFAATDEGKKTLDSLYNISGLVKTSDAEYEPMRKMVVEAGVDVAAAVK